ncbi:AAA family ATPase [Dactylosporangium sucinum]|uniref:ATP/GTP-binding protein n=1 Tax=Dactylosporangium sucinum TaxID=1424081 RepID=A0A917THK7_9ACTN|nr:ATP-binding protein [Dactylosporangium sucinum]GGM22678.1 hypothetical protein GCM10007977_024810 [Dactylosporangium sucinum]
MKVKVGQDAQPQQDTDAERRHLELPRGVGAGTSSPWVLVMAVGAPGSGKSTWISRHFPPQQIVSSDGLREAVCGDPNDQAATPWAIRLLHTLVEGRLCFPQTTVVDATNGQPEHRQVLLDLAAQAAVPAVAVVFDVPAAVCRARNAGRSGSRRVPEQFLLATHASIRATLPTAGPHPPTGFAAAVVIGMDSVRTLGDLPAGLAGGRPFSPAGGLPATLPVPEA